ncbi:uncharacterized protein [Diadema setosum]|uniref:uncharacterized protein n=1 Tax=Diadema setosum TaxID=31175 RepID=UPI003B3B487A
MHPKLSGHRCSSRGMHELVLASVLFTYFLPAGSMMSSFTEGQDALVEYTFPDIAPQSIAVEIRKGSTILFHKTGKENLEASQAKRIEVSTEARGDSTVVRLSINNITREDESAYLCVLYDSQGTMVLESKKKHLSVDFPPGPANCSSTESSEFSIQNYLGSDETWTVINCQATRGMHAGFIACFNPDLRLPPLNMHFNRTHLIGMFWAKKNTPVFCCSATFRNDVDRCTCTEYKSHKEQVLCTSTPNEEEFTTRAYQPDEATPSRPFVSNLPSTDPTPFQGQHYQNDILKTMRAIEIITLCVTLIIFYLVSVTLNYVLSTEEEVHKQAESMKVYIT